MNRAHGDGWAETIVSLMITIADGGSLVHSRTRPYSTVLSEIPDKYHGSVK